MKKRRGSQNPTKLILCRYKHKMSRYDEAVELYERTGRTAQRWQVLLLRHILATDKAGLWVHTKFGYAVPRRNGKNEVVVMREIFGLKNGEHILHTAHRTTTTHAAWERLYDILQKAGIPVASTYRAYGREHIFLKNGGKIEFRTRTSKGGLGEGFDLLVIDEAQEYQDDQESSLKYTVSDSPNPQTILCGTPPTPISAGTVFVKFRQSCLAGELKHSGWAEWSVEYQTDPRDKEAWYLTNPSLGTILNERKITDEIGPDPVDFNIQRLGLWLTYNQKSAISEAEWQSIQTDVVPELTGKIVVGIKFSHDAASVSLGVAARTKDGRIYTEVIDCRSTRSGTAWILDFLKKTAGSTKKVIIDGASGQQLLADEMKAAKLKPPHLPTTRDVITANAVFEPRIEQGILCHSGQPSLAQAASSCEHRAIGSNGGFGYRAIKEGVDISVLDCAVLACWGVDEFKETQIRQRISY